MMGEEWPGGTRLVVGRWPIGEAQSKAGLQVFALRQVVHLPLAVDERGGRVGKRTARRGFDARMADEVGIDHEPITVTREYRVEVMLERRHFRRRCRIKISS